MPETSKFERNLRILRKKAYFERNSHVLEEIRIFWKKFACFERNLQKFEKKIGIFFPKFA